MSNDLTRFSRALQLAQNDVSPARETDARMASRWGVSDRTVRDVRNSEEYRVISEQLRDRTLQAVADGAERLQRMAAERAERIVGGLAEAAAQHLEPREVNGRAVYPDYKAINAAVAVARLLIEIADFKHGAQGATAGQPGGGPPSRMPRLVEADSTGSLGCGWNTTSRRRRRRSRASAC
jgi:hypothetical protein